MKNLFDLDYEVIVLLAKAHFYELKAMTYLCEWLGVKLTLDDYYELVEIEEMMF